jgi:hypothetical protein
MNGPAHKYHRRQFLRVMMPIRSDEMMNTVTSSMMIIMAGIEKSKDFFVTCLTEDPIERSEYA